MTWESRVGSALVDGKIVNLVRGGVRRHAPQHGRVLGLLRLVNRLAVILSIRAASGSHQVGPCSTGFHLCRAGEISGPPKHLRSEAVQRVLSACEQINGLKGENVTTRYCFCWHDSDCVLGKEIVALQLEDIDWANGGTRCAFQEGGMAGHGYRLSKDVGQALERVLDGPTTKPPTETSSSEDTPRTRRSWHQVPVFRFW